MAETVLDPLAALSGLSPDPFGSPEMPPIPLAAPPTLQSLLPKPGIGDKLAPLAILAAALLGGRKTSGLAQGYQQGEQQLQARNLQTAQLAQQDAQRAAVLQQHEAQQQALFAQREDARRGRALQLIHGELSKITDPAQYDQSVKAFASMAQQAGLRTITESQLRLSAPFVAPNAKKIAGDAVSAWLKNPANAEAIKKDPSIVGKVVLTIDTNGDGIPEHVPLMKAGALGGIQFATLEDGSLAPIEGDAKVLDRFQMTYKANLARFVADNRRHPNDAGEQQKLVADSVKQAAEEARRPAEEGDILTLSPAGLDVAALNYAKTGTLPAMGMSKASAGIRSRIINRAADLYPGLDVAANKAGFGADTAALTQLTKLRDSVTAFEKTAGANLDRFIGTAGKVVDTGSPLLNRPFRGVARSLVGSPNMAAFEAARLAAQNEVARVLNTANLSGQLTDTARREMEQALSPNATLPQLLAASKILRADMQTRRESYDAQIAEIKSRQKVTPGQSSSPQTSPTPLSPLERARRKLGGS